jgi:hypothetical protein
MAKGDRFFVRSLKNIRQVKQAKSKSLLLTEKDFQNPKIGESLYCNH